MTAAKTSSLTVIRAIATGMIRAITTGTIRAITTGTIRAITTGTIRAIAFTGLLLGTCACADAQASLVINSAAITLSGNVSLVINDPDTAAIRRSGTGYIQSESAGSQVVWFIGAGSGSTYTVPFGNASGYFPMQFNASSGTGTQGAFVLSTFPTAPVNSNTLPPGVTNMTIGIGDNSAYTLDRFWQIRPQGYMANPTLTDLRFTYPRTALAPPNTITESNLAAYRWNGTLQKWNDYTPASSANTTLHTVTVANVPGNQLHDWWTLADAGVVLPLTLVSFTAKASGIQVLTNWITNTETNTRIFEVWRSKDGISFELAAQQAAAGNSTTRLTYSFTDTKPYPGLSYYRLKTIDLDNRYSWSEIVSVYIGEKETIQLYPNPATTSTTIHSGQDLVDAHTLVNLYDIRGRRLQTFMLTSTSQLVDLTGLPPGIYEFFITNGSKPMTLRFIKK